jgi:predicted dehydrogenase
MAKTLDTKTLGVGIIGCGNISAAYLKLSPLFKGIKVRAVADINMDAARSRAQEFGVTAQTVDQLLSNSDIDIVVNLTIPGVHYAVSKQILEAGKHVYSEKPLTLSVAEGEDLRAIAKQRNLQVACAPDTFLGGAHQLARKTIDDGTIGTIVSGSAHVLGHGMEHWHPNPDFFFEPGGGPVLDMGPYYIANLINFIGPVQRVAALSNTARAERTISSEPRKGEKLTVKTPTTYNALLQFVNGAQITFSASWDVYAHRHQNMELYGTTGALFVPDPNFFGGELSVAGSDAVLKPLAMWEHPLGVPNQEHPHGMVANYRTIGLADMAQGIVDGRDVRCSIDRTLHAVDVLTSIMKSGETGTFIDIGTTCTRPAAFGIAEAKALMA